jgi:thioredoxin 1
MNRYHGSPESRLGSASAGASIAIVLALAAAVALAVVLKGNRQPAPGAAAAAAEPTTEAQAPPSAAAREKAPAAPAPPVGIPKLVDLGAGKCIPCKLMAPILEALKKDFAGKLEVVFIDVWENPDAAKEYDIGLIPTQIFYDASGKERFRHEGFYSREDILAKWKDLGVDLALASVPPSIVREEPLMKDERPADMRCSLCDGAMDAKARVIADAPEGRVSLCSPHCFFVYRTSHRDPKALEGKVTVTDWASGNWTPAETASYLYGTDENGRPTVRAFADKEAAVAERQKDGGDVVSWTILGTKEEAIRCAFCDRATYPADSPKVKVGGAQMYACCVLCGLGVAARFKQDIEMEACDGLTGAAIRMKSLDGRVASLEPSTAVAWFGQKRGPEGNMVSAGCFKQRFFVSADNLKTWVEKHPSATGRLITIQQGLEDKMKMTPEQIKNACKLGECAPAPAAKP